MKRNGRSGRRRRRRGRKQERGSERGGAEKSEEEGYAEKEDRRSPSSKTHPVAFQSLRAVLLLLLEAAAALALVEYVRRELPALGAGATDARRATRHRDTCELTATAGQHRLLSSSFCPFLTCSLAPNHHRRFRLPPSEAPCLRGSCFVLSRRFHTRMSLPFAQNRGGRSR